MLDRELMQYHSKQVQQKAREYARDYRAAKEPISYGGNPFVYTLAIVCIGYVVAKLLQLVVFLWP